MVPKLVHLRRQRYVLGHYYYYIITGQTKALTKTKTKDQEPGTQNTEKGNKTDTHTSEVQQIHIQMLSQYAIDSDGEPRINLYKRKMYLHNWVNSPIPQFSANLNHSNIVQRFGTWPSSGNNNEYRGSHTRAKTSSQKKNGPRNYRTGNICCRVTRNAGGCGVTRDQASATNFRCVRNARQAGCGDLFIAVCTAKAENCESTCTAWQKKGLRQYRNLCNGSCATLHVTPCVRQTCANVTLHGLTAATYIASTVQVTL